MLGYAGDEEATSSVLSDGWLRTGDLGKLDRKGQLTLVGRAKDVIVASSGENVYPDDVEARIGKLEHVQELTVLGIPDGRGGERLACVLIPETADDVPRAKRHERARAALDAARRESAAGAAPGAGLGVRRAPAAHRDPEGEAR